MRRRRYENAARDPAAYDELNRRYTQLLFQVLQMQWEGPPLEVTKKGYRATARWFKELNQLDREAEKMSANLAIIASRPQAKKLTRFCSVVRYAPESKRHFLQSQILKFPTCRRDLFDL